MQHHDILRIVGKFLIPLIMLFALYVQFHGDYGPGGGFQAGVIFSAAFILYGLIFGLDKTREVASPGILKMTAGFGVLLFAITGIVSMLMDGEFLEYNVLAQDPVAGQHLGIILVEFGVGLTVASVMILFFYSFADA